ncbi:uncharacterized protein LOC116190250 [Punica granatum]|uniref:Uncharacterized protein LOC116190250 n=1 Tax=Punica granatum TaxID=22663 RepID=A0A6P8BXJ9_PUNGR|nr:uncharacterized protein LOC116190250 [Punica granatum]
MLVWNCREAGNANFRRSLKDLVNTHNPDIVILTETLLSGDRATQAATVGDFNEVASSIDKIGGRAVNVNRMSTFNTMLDTCSLTDLGYTGPRHTWTNLHSSLSLIMERLNRAVANPTWHLLFPEASVHHLPHIHSDHCPLLLKLNPAMETTPNRPFRFESKWLSHIGFKKLVLQSWEQANFDHN